MPDITLCTNNDCPVGARCERRTAAPSIRQLVHRFEFVEDESGIKCDKFGMLDSMSYTNHYLINVD